MIPKKISCSVQINFRVVNNLLGKNDTGIYVKERENLGLAINDLYLPVSQKQDSRSPKTAGKNTRIKWMAKYVIYESVFCLAGLNQSGPVSD